MDYISVYEYTNRRVYIYGDISIYTGIQDSHIRFWPTLHTDICLIQLHAGFKEEQMGDLFACVGAVEGGEQGGKFPE